MLKWYQKGLELHHLQSFMAVAHELSFRRAAQELHLAQPALSRHIQQLEHIVGYRLFDRDTRGTRLTEPGLALADGLKPVLAELGQTLRRAEEAAEGRRGRLRVVYSIAAISSYLPEVLQAFRQRRPEVRLELQELESAEQHAAVLAGRVDCAFTIMEPPARPELKVIPLFREQIGVVVPRDHAAARLERVKPQMLAGLDYISFPRHFNPRLYDSVLAFFHREDFNPALGPVAINRINAMGQVITGSGFTTINAASAHLGGPGTAFRPFDGEGVPELPHTFSYLAANTNPTLQAMRACVQERFGGAA